MDERFIQMIGKDIVDIANEWSQLSVEDLLEIKDKGYKRIYCVYDSWENLAEVYVDKDIPEYIKDCIDYTKLGIKLSEGLSFDDYVQLQSGKVIQGI